MPTKDWEGDARAFYLQEYRLAGEALAQATGPDRLKRWALRLPIPSDRKPPPSRELESVLATAVHAFRSDARSLLSDLELEISRNHVTLRVENRTDEEAIRIAEQLISLLERLPHARTGSALRRRPWVLGTLLVALATVGLSFCSISAVALVALGIATAATTVVAVGYAAWRHAEGVSTALKMMPVVLMVGFALIYGAAGTGDHLRDPLILSLQAMVTGGFGDIETFGWTRSIVYLEMLLLWVGVTVAIVAVARRFERIDVALADEPPKEPEASAI